MPPDESETDIERQAPRPDPVNPPLARPAPALDEPPCGDGAFDADVSLLVASEQASVAVPVLADVVVWDLQMTLYYGPYRIKWAQQSLPGVSLPLVAPVEALVDGFQTEWLSRVRVIATATGTRGNEVGSLALEPVWLVWDGGDLAAPRWLSDSDRLAQAPLGAWSTLAKDGVRGVGDGEGGPVEVEPPVGGAL